MFFKTSQSKSVTMSCTIVYPPQKDSRRLKSGFKVAGNRGGGCTVLFLLACSALVQARSDDTLTLAQCIDIALMQSPLMMSAQGARTTARGSYEASRAALLPQVGITSSLTESQGNPSGPKSNGETYNVNAQAQMLLFDFSKTITKVQAGRKQLDAADTDAVSARQNLILAVHISYYTLLQTMAIDSIAIEAVQQADAHVNQTKALLEAGRGVRYNVIKAEVDAQNAKLTASRAHNTVALARVQLENTLGTRIGDHLIDRTEIAEPASDSLSLDSALALALQNRPDVQAARLRLTASELQVKATRRSFLPALSANAGYGFQTTDLSSPWTSGWNAGFGLTVPLFSGGALIGGFHVAQGNLLAARAVLEIMEQNVSLDIRQQYLFYAEALQRTDIARKTVELATVALSLAKERFAAGSGNALEMSDAALSLSNAQVVFVSARADYRIAYARLHRAIGDLQGPITN